MRVLVIGGGGREHAMVWKLVQSAKLSHIFCAPGNAGISRVAECINIQPLDLSGLEKFAEKQRIDLTVVGPEAPLARGIVDRFESRGLPIFGPSTDPARIESSKIFSKDLMQKYDIPTAAYSVVTSHDEAVAAVTAHFRPAQAPPLVIKADGLAGGKGVIIASDLVEAAEALDQMMVRNVFGDAGAQVLLEEWLEGEEFSLIAFTDGYTVSAMPITQDHKRIFDNDMGPNTGGMGAYTPVSGVSDADISAAVQTVLQPAVDAVRHLGIPYKGILYAGMMLTPNGLRTIEFNCRFGDPEAQTLLPLLKTDLLDVLLSVVECRLDTIKVDWHDDASACIVASSAGYPAEYATGKVIEGLDAAAQEGVTVFHSGTSDVNGQFLTEGGRVLSITATAPDLGDALEKAYSAMGKIHFEGMHYRRDIGAKSLRG